jgi:hypothetical protein
MTQEGIGELIKRNGISTVLVGLMVLTGSGTFINLGELKQALTEIHELHKELFESIDRQKEMKADLAKLLAK